MFPSFLLWASLPSPAVVARRSAKKCRSSSDDRRKNAASVSRKSSESVPASRSASASVRDPAAIFFVRASRRPRPVRGSGSAFLRVGAEAKPPLGRESRRSDSVDDLRFAARYLE